MKASKSIWGNPWPADMVLTIECHERHLLELLFVRYAWSLNVTGVNVPSVLSPVPRVGSHRIIASEPGLESWETVWASMWNEAETWCAQFDIGQDASRLDTWRERNGRANFDDDAYHEWRGELGTEELTTPLNRTPERLSIEAAVRGWENGLRSVMVVPIAGNYSLRLSEATLLVSAETRKNRENYSIALGAEVGHGGVS